MINSKRKINIICSLISLSILLSGTVVLNAANDSAVYTVSAAAEEKYSGVTVYAGGMPFGVRFQTNEVTVVKTNSFVSSGVTVSPASEAGIKENDIIRFVNGKEVKCVNDIQSVIYDAKGDITITVQRSEQKFDVTLTAKKSDDDGENRIGVMLKDSSAGIGTVTYIKDKSFVFAGLGHGICDAKTGEIIKMTGGYISDVTINGINKGTPGSPGELRGSFENDKCGKLLSNTEVGVYGIFTEHDALSGKPYEVAEIWEVEKGAATILCTLDNNSMQEYKIDISEINTDDDSKTKNYVVKVTDKILLEKTGGIVQGMSGSPIFQNGKIIGAITHVMINDPTTGYGIYIGNMLDEMNRIV